MPILIRKAPAAPGFMIREFRKELPHSRLPSPGEKPTGSLPFSASDPMELVHCHIARQPEPPGERLKDIPGPVSATIMKLLAKVAEERYQTSAGAASDLRRRLAQ